MKKEEVKYQLTYPGKKSRGRTRWWWYGCAVDKEEIIRELNFMQEAGIGGVELQILYPLEVDQKEQGIENHPYLSPGFMEMVRFAADETIGRKMQFDLTLGSSWPFGGPFLTEELSGQTVLPFAIDVQGPCTFSWDLTTVIYGTIVGAVIGEMKDAKMVPETIKDISGWISEKQLFRWPWGIEIKEIPIPAGVHKIVLLVSSDKKQRVLKPLPGGEGLIVDHNNSESLRTFLEYAGDSIIEAIGENKVTNFFCDSLEVFGHNWTRLVYEEFRTRRGYELSPYIYALWGEIDGLTEQIRYDFHKTMAELTLENFFQELTRWCHEKGAVSRIQAHGTWGDVLQAYGAADIPEGETFSEFDKYEVNTIHRRLAVSGAHLYRKPVISNESFTWLRFPRFVVTLEQIKVAADGIFLDGVNQIVNHGYSYSKEDQESALYFYASTNISHTNTWWHQYKIISKYINRVCEFMQRGEEVVTTAIYLPQHDIWAEMPLADIHMCMKLEERLETRCVDGIHKAGYWFDYVNDEGLENWEQYNYDTLLLIDCERIPIRTMKKICAFAAAGKTVIAAVKMPSKACGLLCYQENCRKIVSYGEELKAMKNVIVTADKFETLIKELNKIKEPDVRILNHPDKVGYVHRRTGTEDIYFIANVSGREVEEMIMFQEQNDHFCVFDPYTAQEKMITAMQTRVDGIRVSLQLEAWQSLLFIFSQEMEQMTAEPAAAEETEILDISLDWQFEVAEKQFKKQYHQLAGWEFEPELKYYSGTGSYKKKFVLNNQMWNNVLAAEKVYLDIGNIGETAEIYVNSVLIDTLIKHPFRVDITGCLKKDKNHIEVLVTNLLINRMIDPQYPEVEETKKIIPQWPYAAAGLNQNRREWLFNHRERQAVKDPFPSGLWGTIKIVGAKRIK